MATKNINTNSFASTNNNSKEENIMKANMNTFAQDHTRQTAYALKVALEELLMIIADAIIEDATDEDMKKVYVGLSHTHKWVLEYVNDAEGPCVILAEADLPGALLILETIEADEIDNYLHPHYETLKKAIAEFILSY